MHMREINLPATHQSWIMIKQTLRVENVLRGFAEILAFFVFMLYKYLARDDSNSSTPK